MRTGVIYPEVLMVFIMIIPGKAHCRWLSMTRGRGMKINCHVLGHWLTFNHDHDHEIQIMICKCHGDHSSWYILNCGSQRDWKKWDEEKHVENWADLWLDHVYRKWAEKGMLMFPLLCLASCSELSRANTLAWNWQVLWYGFTRGMFPIFAISCYILRLISAFWP